jgi:hypothetical protein
VIFLPPVSFNTIGVGRYIPGDPAVVCFCTLSAD